MYTPMYAKGKVLSYQGVTVYIGWFFAVFVFGVPGPWLGQVVSLLVPGVLVSQARGQALAHQEVFVKLRNTMAKKSETNPHGGGRPLGVQNKTTLDRNAILAILQEKKADPFAFLAAVMSADYEALGLDKESMYIPLRERLTAARELASYIAPRLRSVDLTSGGKPLGAGETFAGVLADIHGTSPTNGRGESDAEHVH